MYLVADWRGGKPGMSEGLPSRDIEYVLSLPYFTLVIHFPSSLWTGKQQHRAEVAGWCQGNRRNKVRSQQPQHLHPPEHSLLFPSSGLGSSGLGNYTGDCF